MSQPEQLPEGIWTTLLPRALTLIDEIAKYGGLKEPFYTFGGGTVLMLRYQHRLSKDIDIFLPDPQSLGYVTPRLSDTADEMCKSQYVEAANFVKLQFDEGEIDFVASPNLLPAHDAFEHWELFGRRVRVETAAEIVAKKMFHRGDKTTARDLFDLALVIEREPEALSKAEPFLYRHLDLFLAHVQMPSAGFIRQFEGIDTIGNCQPSFGHAASVAIRFIDSLIQKQKQSACEALAFADAQGLGIEAMDVNRGDYVGPLLHGTSHHVVQNIGRSVAVIHEKHRLPAGIKWPSRDISSIHIRYRGGLAQMIKGRHL